MPPASRTSRIPAAKSHGESARSPKSVETSGGNPREIERRSTRAANAGDLALHGGKLIAKFRGIAATRMRNAAADDALGQIAPPRDAQAPLVQKSTAAALGREQLITHGIEYDARDWQAVLHDSDRDREQRNAVEEIGGAIQGINHPVVRSVGTFDRPALFHDEAEGGTGLGKFAIDHVFRAAVGIGNKIRRAF